MSDRIFDLRRAVAEAVLLGHLDSELATYLTTAEANGYVPDRLVNVQLGGHIGNRYD